LHHAAKYSAVLFDILHLNRKAKAQSFLTKDLEERSDDPSYQDFRRAASAVTVVNDSALRATAVAAVQIITCKE
jgi:hypothetical protein